MGSSRIAQGDQLCALWPRGVGSGGWEGDARERRYGDICICIADSLCYNAETNTPLIRNYTPIKMLEKKREREKASRYALTGGCWLGEAGGTCVID